MMATIITTITIIIIIIITTTTIITTIMVTTDLGLWRRPTGFGPPSAGYGDRKGTYR